MSEPVIMFGRFEFFPMRRLLLDAGSPVRLGGRATDLLAALVRHAGDVVSQDRLIAEVWPNIYVESNTLRVQIVAIRKALGEGAAGNRFILNVPGRGYAFVAPITAIRQVPDDALSGQNTPLAAIPGLRHLPITLPGTIGRSDVIRIVAAQLPQRRLVTIVGPGGIGKTVVAAEVAKLAAAARTHAAIFVDLATVADPMLVAAAVAAALELPPHLGGPTAALAAFQPHGRTLLLLDTCEHVVDAVATLVEQVLRRAPDLLILATSREPLRAAGEWVHRLPPLDLPPRAVPLSAAEALGYPAVQLFVERAAAHGGGFDLKDADATHVAEICRRLDGIPLAIELAAARLDAFGLPGLTSLLDDGFQLLTAGRRSALPRHRTLGATMEWSYNLLSAPEREALRRLSVFPGTFTLTSAAAVAAVDSAAARRSLGDHLALLVTKSLVVAEITGPEPQYRLLETTRAFARGKLEVCAEVGTSARRHAIYHLRLFERAAAEWASRRPNDWVAAYGPRLDDLRAALGWSFGKGGDLELGVALAVAALPMWFQFLLVDEGFHWVERALKMIDWAESAREEHRQSMTPRAALGGFLMHGSMRGMSAAEARKVALRLAGASNATDYRVRALRASSVTDIDPGHVTPRVPLQRRSSH